MQAAPVVRFGAFELDLRVGELRKQGLKIKLQDQPFQILVMLLEQPGQVVTREQIHQKLWPDGTFVDFEHGLNAAIQRLRQALGDSAENPRFVETLARRGYRFVAPVNGLSNGVATTAAQPAQVVYEVMADPRRTQVREQHQRRWKFLPWTVIAILSVTVVVLAAVHFSERPKAHTVRLQLSLPDRVSMGWEDLPVVSPDGQRLVFSGTDADGKRRLWVRSLDSLTAQALAGSENAKFPFWSPDSRFIAFGTFGLKGELKKIDLTDATLLKLCDTGVFAGATWSGDGVILFSQWSTLEGSSLYRVSAAGGEVRPVLKFDKSRRENDHPQFLPDGQHFVYRSLSAFAGAENGAIYLGSLDSNETRMLIPVASNVRYLPPRYLVYGRRQNLLAQPFDVKNLRLTGGPFTLAEQVARHPDDNCSLFSTSENGILVYRGAAMGNMQLAWYKRDGARLASIGEPGSYEQISMSPDEARLAGSLFDRQAQRHVIWTLELSNSIFSRLTLHTFSAGFPIWSPNSRELIFTSNQRAGEKFHLYRIALGGGHEELLFESNEREVAQQWLRDGSVLFTSGRPARDFYAPSTAFYRLPLSGARKPVLLLETGSAKTLPHISSDGRWVAYQSDESGKWEIYIANFPTFTERQQVSNNGGCQALWGKDHKELFYLSLDGKLMSVDVKGGERLETDAPRGLFNVPGPVEPLLPQYSMTRDGKRFIFLEPVREPIKSLTVVLNSISGIE